MTENNARSDDHRDNIPWPDVIEIDERNGCCASYALAQHGEICLAEVYIRGDLTGSVVRAIVHTYQENGGHPVTVGDVATTLQDAHWDTAYDRAKQQPYEAGGDLDEQIDRRAEDIVLEAVHWRRIVEEILGRTHGLTADDNGFIRTSR